jgi:disulfide bond formation protein DsbB
MYLPFRSLVSRSYQKIWLRIAPPIPLAFLTVLVVSTLLIGVAYFFEFGMGLKPCALCLYQRYPYFLAMILALLGLLLLRNLGIQKVFCLLLGGIFLIGAGLGAWHAGIEWGFFAGPDSCSAPVDIPAQIDAFRTALNQVRVVNCAQAPWRFLGVSLAGWNSLISLDFAGFCFIAGFYGSSSLSQYK